MLGWSGQLPDGQETSMGREQDGLGWGVVLPRLSAQYTWWMDTAECRGVVGQRKLFSVVTGKRNMSKVSPGLGCYQQGHVFAKLSQKNLAAETFLSAEF